MKPRPRISFASTLDDKGKAQLNMGQAAAHKDLLKMRWWIVMSEGGRQQLRGMESRDVAALGRDAALVTKFRGVARQSIHLCGSHAGSCFPNRKIRRKPNEQARAESSDLSLPFLCRPVP
jgi:hypothetical protein